MFGEQEDAGLADEGRSQSLMYLAPGLEFDLPDCRANPEILAQRDEIREGVWAGIMKLGENDREILVLRHFQHLSYREIAEALAIPQGTVMSRLFTARSRLRDLLSGLMPVED